MSKAKSITLSSTPTCHDHDTYVILIDGMPNSVWDDLDASQDEVERLDALGNKAVSLIKLKKNIRYASPAEKPRTVVVTGLGTYIDSDGTVWERNSQDAVGVTRIRS